VNNKKREIRWIYHVDAKPCHSYFIAGVSLIIAVALAINGFVGYKQKCHGGITATGRQLKISVPT
jgi:hypothetical protein